MRCLIYARVSNDPRGLGLSVTQQVAECRAWAAREGWDVTGVVKETGSASRYAKGGRDEWDRVGRELTTGKHDALLTWEASRATRDLTAYAALRDLCAAHGVAWGYSGSLHDLGSSEGRFRTGLDALLAEQEAARTSERVLRGVRARAAEGRPHGRLPYGYRREYDEGTGQLARQVPHETTAGVVREVFTRVASGDTLTGIARDLEARGVPAPRGDRWLRITLKRLVTSPTYKGRRVHQGVDIGPATWPPLVDPELWDRAAAVVTAPGRGVTREGARWLLSGIAVCGVCGATVRKETNRMGRAAYTCSRGGHVSRDLERVDAHVVAVVLELIRHHQDQLAAGPTVDPAVVTARADVAELRARLDGFIDQAVAGDLSPSALARVEQQLRPRIDAAEATLRRLVVPSPVAEVAWGDPEATWAALDVPRRRMVVRAVVGVELLPVTPGRAPQAWDPSRVAITARWG